MSVLSTVSMYQSKFVALKSCLESELHRISDLFLEKGVIISSSNEIGTYQYWRSKGRQVLKGEKSIKYKTEDKYPRPVFRGKSPVLDSSGKPVIRMLQTSYSLFHISQTK